MLLTYAVSVKQDPKINYLIKGKSEANQDETPNKREIEDMIQENPIIEKFNDDIMIWAVN